MNELYNLKDREEIVDFLISRNFSVKWVTREKAELIYPDTKKSSPDEDNARIEVLYKVTL